MALTVEQQIEEIWKLFKETDRELKESNRKFDRQMEESKKEYEKRSKDIDEKIKRLSDLFESQWGKLVKALVEPGVLQLFEDRGIQVDYVHRRSERYKNGRKMEIDLLLVDADEVVVVEVKTTCKTDDVRDFLEDLHNFLDFFPFYKNYKIYGAIAAINMDKEAARFAYRQGLFVLKAGKEGIIQILNDLKFKPKNFALHLKIKM